MILKRIKERLFFHKLNIASGHERAEMLRDKFYYLGKNVELYTTDIGNEPYLISIHDNVVVAGNVKFVNHDYSIATISRYLRLDLGEIDKVGSIELFDNCFIGTDAILMPNSSVGKNSVIAAGSVVTKHVPDEEVWGGVPAHFIMTTKDLAIKMKKTSDAFPWMPLEKKQNMSLHDLIIARQNFFFNK